MKPVRRHVIAITVTGALTGSAVAALADTAEGKPFEGVVVEDVIVVDQFPTEVQGGSIAVNDDDERAMVAQAKIASGDAARIAQTALPGQVVETQLGDENGFLVWEVEVIDDKGQEAQLKIDAGDGRLLAVEAGNQAEHEGEGDREDRNGDRDDHDGDREDRDEDKHSRWKFWEDHDQDERGAERG